MRRKPTGWGWRESQASASEPARGSVGEAHSSLPALSLRLQIKAPPLTTEGRGFQ
ncbi:hypothetical protein GCM10007359_11450 [Rothia aerolata]|uniref:Uncharacterized protein n=1 Tax=Rothia aerolata TaxID=1812262 RepID=A0A917IT02_9MICC|nr:hypothetical protein GCM10007359_11450 [Rothia aerolata]